jgi:3-hydroxyacyl-CoA dehydrogenase/enoyl-CoA hydratase/3-hydroxybutyryl-CoA epimerase
MLQQQEDQIQYLNWQIHKDSNHIIWLLFDREAAKINTLNRTSFDELDLILSSIEKDDSVKGIIMGSAKSTGFLAGADIQQFSQVKDIEKIKADILRGQQVFNHLAELNLPTVAMIDGFCLGGGLELALACRYRVATDNKKTRLGLPEVLLGIHPGWGGTVRLPALIGAKEAFKLILSGKLIDAKKAAKLGIIDAAVPRRQLENAARYYILEKPAPHHPSTLEALSNTAIMRPLLAKMIERETAVKIKREHYPAQFAVIDNWRQFGIELPKALNAERESMLKLVETNTTRNLLRVFYLRERLKAFAKDIQFTCQHVHVVGAGVMGGDIAAWCALSGLRVTLQDREPHLIAPAIKRAYKLFKDKLKEPRLIQAALDRIIPDIEGIGLTKADVIIEAIVENLAAKQELFKKIEMLAKADAILATNTSSIPLSEISTILKQPERLLGIHFFNPVAKMLLVEIVHSEMTSDQITQKAQAFVHQLDRLPLPVKSSPGFLVNRVLMPYLMEAFVLFEEGVPPAIIDKAALNFGMPMGPIELADTVGLDICLSVAENLTKHYGGTVPERLKQMVVQGRLGKKSGQGFYPYNKSGEAQKPSTKDYPLSDDIIDRMVLRLVNEAMACLRERIVADGDLVDAGMIFGTGFAPFRGGPINYACETGVAVLKQKLEMLEQKYGKRFKPDAEWDVQNKHE